MRESVSQIMGYQRVRLEMENEPLLVPVLH